MSDVLRPGQTFGNGYVVERLLAENRTDAAFIGQRIASKQRVAIRVSKPAFDTDDALQTLLTNMRTAGQRNPELIGDAIDSGYDEQAGLVFVVLELPDATGDDGDDDRFRRGGPAALLLERELLSTAATPERALLPVDSMRQPVAILADRTPPEEQPSVRAKGSDILASSPFSAPPPPVDPPNLADDVASIPTRSSGSLKLALIALLAAGVVSGALAVANLIQGDPLNDRGSPVSAERSRAAGQTSATTRVTSSAPVDSMPATIASATQAD